MSVATITPAATTSNVADAALNAQIAAKVAAPAKAPKAAKVVTKGHVTKALTGLTLAKTAKAKAVKVDDTKSVTAVKTANDGLRIDHSTCSHASKGSEGKKARAACRAAVAKALKPAAKK